MWLSRILLMSVAVVGFSLLGGMCTPQTAVPSSVPIVPVETVIPVETIETVIPIKAVASVSAPPSPTATPAVPLAIVKKTYQSVDLLEGPFGHTVASVTLDGLTRYHGENTVLRADLPAGTELTVIGQFFDCAVLQVRLPDGATGWVNRYQPNFPFMEQFSKLDVNFDCAAISEGVYRPWTGAFQGRQGHYEKSNIDQLIIVNKTEYDVLAVLVDESDVTTNSVYVRSSEELGVPLLGKRFVFISMGREWLVNSNRVLC